MKVFLSALIIIFSFQSWTKADSIKELNIEGFEKQEESKNHLEEGKKKKSRKKKSRKKSTYGMGDSHAGDGDSD